MKTKKKIGSRIFLGQGPNDMLQPVFVKNDKKLIQLYDMATSCLFEYDVNTFVNNESPTPLNKIKLEKRPINSIEVLNNRIYGLTKGQYSPTSERGFVSKSSPYGTVEDPFRPAELCFGARGHFFARAVATDAPGTVEVLKAALHSYFHNKWIEKYKLRSLFSGKLRSNSMEPCKCLCKALRKDLRQIMTRVSKNGGLT